ncbi:uncharacterized protein EI90DRAFT_3134707 [Cantharellus anzutake]|uniref:uncharacterized protein n=1 Tax=Cantharellus anzutake TaxID=1750568 RepID=UPI001904BF40|nr:uncharacterized protein EI90DRAFT_3134707 [Cantharellus anzutake]KAF8316211.1 hypothetical protein EI90DRAFT_3134707 [Cantharellus anzutake]
MWLAYHTWPTLLQASQLQSSSANHFHVSIGTFWPFRVLDNIQIAFIHSTLLQEIQRQHEKSHTHLTSVASTTLTVTTNHFLAISDKHTSMSSTTEP